MDRGAQNIKAVVIGYTDGYCVDVLRKMGELREEAVAERAAAEAEAERRRETERQLATREWERDINHAAMLVALEMARHFQGKGGLPSALDHLGRALKERDKALAEAAMWKEEAQRARRIINDLPSRAAMRAALEESLSALAPAWADITRPLRDLLPKGATIHTGSDGSGGPAGR